MGLLRIQSQGTWWTHSATDPRWDHSESAMVGSFDHSKARAWIAQMTPILGEPPDDLDVGYMKD